MANVDIKLGYKGQAFFDANPTLVLKEGQIIFLSGTTKFKIGDNSTQLNALSFNDALFQSTSEKAQANGYASLDGGGKIPASQLPATVMELKGAYNAATNTPTLADGSGSAGDVYEVTTAGTVNFGGGAITFKVGDWVVYGADNLWYKSLNSNEVTSVNGLFGAVVLSKSDIGLSNVDNTSDVGKPVSTAQAAAIALKESVLTFGSGLVRTVNAIVNTLITGLAGGQTIIGGTAVGDGLIYKSTTANGTSTAIAHSMKGGNDGATTLFSMTNAGNAGLGAAPDAGYRFSVTGANTFGGMYLTVSGGGVGQIIQGTAELHRLICTTSGSSVTDTRWTYQTTSNLATGGGSGHAYFMKNASGVNKTAFRSSVIYSNATNGAEQTAFKISTMVAGAALAVNFNFDGDKAFIGGSTTPTAKVHIAAGAAAAGAAPLKLTAGTNLSVVENGAFEFDGTNLYFTVGGVRKTVTLV